MGELSRAAQQIDDDMEEGQGGASAAHGSLFIIIAEENHKDRLHRIAWVDRFPSEADAEKKAKELDAEESNWNRGYNHQLWTHIAYEIEQLGQQYFY